MKGDKSEGTIKKACIYFFFLDRAEALRGMH